MGAGQRPSLPPCTHFPELEAVTRKIPSYLRLHQDRSSAATTLAKASVPRSPGKNAQRAADPIADFWQAYDLATGWRLDAAHDPRTQAAVSQPIALGALAEAANRLASSYQDSLAALRRQGAELATYAFSAQDTTGGSGIGCDRAESLSERLQQRLQHAVAATGCDTAALYTLNEATTRLKTRAVVGLSIEHLLAGSRSLRGSRGDLEALVNEVVAIDDLAGSLSTTWNSPADFPSAMIVKLEQDDLPIGTLWFWSSQPRSFTTQDTAAAKLAAEMIAGELSAARAQSQQEQRRGQEQETSERQTVRAVGQWQMRQMPPAMELAPGCVVDGWAESPKSWACSWHAWDVLPDGKISLALAQAAETELAGAMIAATARAAWAAHSAYRHSVAEMLARISDSLWSTNTGDQLVAMLYAQWDPDSGEGEFASAGDMQAIIVDQRGYRPLCHAAASPLLASSPDGQWASHRFRLQPGEALVAVNAAVLHRRYGISQTRWAQAAREALQQPAAPILATIRRQLAGKNSPEERAGVVLQYRERCLDRFRPAAPR